MGLNSKQNPLCSSSISLENRKMLLKTYVLSIRMRNLDNWRTGKKEIRSFRNVVLQKNEELQMKKLLDESEKEEPCGRVWRREEVRWWCSESHRWWWNYVANSFVCVCVCNLSWPEKDWRFEGFYSKKQYPRDGPLGNVVRAIFLLSLILNS